jgi:protein-S-isoprenylcysteine O-methyltransferase Ste14
MDIINDKNNLHKESQMNFDFSLLPEHFGLAGFLLWALSERWFQLLKSQQTDGNQRDHGSFLMISLFWYATVIISILDAYYTHWTTDIPFNELRWFGIPIIAVGLIVRIQARRILKQQYSTFVKTSVNHRLITTGIYAQVRHPAYLGLLLLFLGIPLSSWSLLGLGIAIVGGIPAILYRIKVEERFLVEVFGKQYQEYAESTWKILPTIW